ncbi:N-acetyl-gamma-glutamyl-phosphate reductase [Kangiella sp. HD9-110m-PIT-SAG07]|nr:N-acetyl-gamma-glutamyl-phosphate reductase [Kangiella sp. HD9-110m-PIT-SAG07]
MSIKAVLVGARGYVGTEIITILSSHPSVDLIAASSRELDGQEVKQYKKSKLFYQNLMVEDVVTLSPDLIILALPNGLAEAFVKSVDTQRADTTIIDLSADYRFDKGWHYGLPEIHEHKSSKRISNPGCYATAMQFCIAPVKELVNGRISCFGISGYSGAGTTPSDKNDLNLLKDNIMPYSLANHLHEKEVTHHLSLDIKFSPHVAEYFRGISLTSHIPLKESLQLEQLEDLYRMYYEGNSLVNIQKEPPQVTQVTGLYSALIGGLTLSESGTHLAINCVIDNLLKGAASQAVQNINLAFGLPQLEGLTVQ